jgi:hypothetical protein
MELRIRALLGEEKEIEISLVWRWGARSSFRIQPDLATAF